MADAFPGARGLNNVPFTQEQRDQQEGSETVRVGSTAQLEHSRSALLCCSDQQQGANIPCFPEQSNSTFIDTMEAHDGA